VIVVVLVMVVVCEDVHQLFFVQVNGRPHPMAGVVVKALPSYCYYNYK